jgi:hypothetical protein
MFKSGLRTKESQESQSKESKKNTDFWAAVATVLVNFQTFS